MNTAAALLLALALLLLALGHFGIAIPGTLLGLVLLLAAVFVAVAGVPWGPRT